MNDLIFSGIDPTELSEVLAAGEDCNGVAIQPFIDEEGGWPMRCCLADSQPGEEVAIIAWSPYAWNGPYRETGPIVVHTAGCAGTWQQPSLPGEFDRRRMTLRPYDADHRILYDLVVAVPEGGSLTALTANLLERPEVAEVYGRNISGGCFAFVARQHDHAV